MKFSLPALTLTGVLALGALTACDGNFRRTVDLGGQSTTATEPSTATTESGTTTPPATDTGAGTATPTPATFDNGRARTESEANTVQVVKEQQNGLVFISVTESSANSEEAQLRQRLQQQFGIPDTGAQPSQGTGSGFFVNKQGDIITNNHVVEGASEITIKLHDQKEYKAKVIARAPDFDLALIRAENVPAASIQPIPLGDSDQLDVGLKAIAMGAPFGLDFSVSEGIISNLERTVPVGQPTGNRQPVYQKVIQTDAAINPGNSGGPLLNSAGQVIGVNTQILTGGIGQSAGVGFAIPVNTVKRLLPQLQSGKTEVIQPPTLGIQFTDLSGLPEDFRTQNKLPDTGALLQRVYPNSPASRANLQAGTNAVPLGAGNAGEQISTNGDIITAIDGQPVTEGEDLRRAVIGKAIGDKITLSLTRGGQTRQVTVELQAFDFPQQTQQ